MAEQQHLLPPVTLNDNFYDLFGRKKEELNESERRHRWAAWLRLVRRKDRDCADYWRTVEACVERGKCRHLRGTWCELQGLPASVNPILSRRLMFIGMACMGMGYEPEGEAMSEEPAETPDLFNEMLEANREALQALENWTKRSCMNPAEDPCPCTLCKLRRVIAKAEGSADQ